jgi:hypothetical protein
MAVYDYVSKISHITLIKNSKYIVIPYKKYLWIPELD